MEKKHLFFLVFLLIGKYVFSQGITNSTNSKTGTKSASSVKWKTVPFDHQVFIANAGQFDGSIPGNEKILYGAQLGNIWAYFTNHGIVYCYKERPINEEKESKEDPDEREQIKPVTHYLTGNWESSNTGVTIENVGKQSYYYTYPVGVKGTIKTDIFKKIIYHNLYPGIDIEYMFPKGKEGIKYSIIVHPGANLNNVRLAYSNADGLKINNEGEVVFNSKLGEFTDHAPLGFYSGGEGNIGVSYTISGNIESFKIDGNYDRGKTVIIDPWTTNPGMPLPYDRAYDLDYDYAGNVYAYGSWAPNQLEKFNNVGAPQWVYNSSPFYNGYYGDLVTNRITGTTYLTEGYNGSGASVIKVWNNGSYQGISPGIPGLNEMWRAVYVACNDTIVLGAGGTAGQSQACVLDTNLGAPNPVNVLGAINQCHDMVLIAADPSGQTCYMATSHSICGAPYFSDVVIQVPVHNNLSPTAYITPDNFGFVESNVPSYVGDGNARANGYDGMAASPSWLYIYNSITLKRLNKSNGQLVDSIPISNAVLIGGKPNWGGLAVDQCDDIFVGCHDSIKTYNSSMRLNSSTRLANTVYDVVYGNNLLYACGDSFVCAVIPPPLARLISSAGGSPSSCQACDGRATVTVNCGVPPFAFLWSNGSTNQTDTGLCAGLYTVTVTDGSCPPRYDTAIVSISGKAGYAATVVDTNPGCQLNRGYIKVFPYGGATPYTYSWSNGATTQQISGLSAGTYICTIIDNAGCKYEQDVTLINASPVTVNVVPVKDSICPGTPIPIIASGTDKYSWTPHVGLSCYNCANPTATTSVSVTYTVIGSDTLGCENSATVTIKVLPAPKPVIKGRSPVCTGFSDTLIAKGGTSYTWSNGATTDTIIVVATNETLTVTASNGVCSDTTTFTIITDLPDAVITATYDSVCSKSPDTLTAGGGDSYSWQPGGRTSPLIVVTPSITTTYTLSATDNQGGCVSTAAVTIDVIKDISSTVHLSQDSICQGTQTSLDVVSSGNVVLSYLWSTGATTTVITVTPNADTTFYVIAQGKCNKDSVAKKVNVIPLPIPVIAPLDSVCKGSNDTLTVSGGTEYLWSNGSTKTTYIIKDMKADSSITVIAYNYRDKKCKVSETVNIPEKPLPSAKTQGATICAGQCITLKAIPSGGGYYTFSWSNGAMIDSTVVCPTTDTAYYVTVFNGCKSPRAAAEIQVFPQSLLVCCDTTIKEYASSNTTVSASGKYQGDTAILTANKGKSYVWTPSSSLNCDTCQTVIATPTVTTTYTVNAIDSNGCTDVTTVTVKVEFPCFDFNVPNVFTPNGDNINDYFLVKTENLDSYSITIYDRWGKQMFSSNNPSQYWDGNTEGGSKAADGVYYWIITTNCQGTNNKKDGFVQLIR